MKIVLFNSVGNIGIVIDWKRLIDQDNLKFEVDRDGELQVGQRIYKVSMGQAHVPQHNILLGESYKIIFTDENGQAYNCGVIQRTGSRLINIVCELEACLIACVEKITSQDKEIKKLNEKMSKIENEYGVSFR